MSGALVITISEVDPVRLQARANDVGLQFVRSDLVWLDRVVIEVLLHSQLTSSVVREAVIPNLLIRGVWLSWWRQLGEIKSVEAMPGVLYTALVSADIQAQVMDALSDWNRPC